MTECFVWNKFANNLCRSFFRVCGTILWLIFFDKTEPDIRFASAILILVIGLIAYGLSSTHKQMNIQNILQRKGLELDLLWATLAMLLSLIEWFDLTPRESFEYWFGNLIWTVFLGLVGVIYSRLLRRGGPGLLLISVVLAGYYLSVYVLPETFLNYLFNSILNYLRTIFNSFLGLTILCFIAIAILFVQEYFPKDDVSPDLADDVDSEDLILLDLRD